MSSNKGTPEYTFTCHFNNDEFEGRADQREVRAISVTEPPEFRNAPALPHASATATEHVGDDDNNLYVPGAEHEAAFNPFDEIGEGGHPPEDIADPSATAPTAATSGSGITTTTTKTTQTTAARMLSPLLRARPPPHLRRPHIQAPQGHQGYFTVLVQQVYIA